MAIDPEVLRILQLSEVGEQIITRLEDDIRVLEAEVNRLKTIGVDTSDLETQLKQAKEQLQKLKQLKGTQ